MTDAGVLTSRDTRVGAPLNSVPVAPETDRGQAFSVQPTEGESYAGVLFNQTDPLQPGKIYSFRAAVRPSVAGEYQLDAGVYAQVARQSEPIQLPADRWTTLQVDDVTATDKGLPFLTLRKAAGAYTGTESITFDCAPAAPGGPGGDPHGGQPGCFYRVRTATATKPAAPSGGGEAQRAHRGGGRTTVEPVREQEHATSAPVAMPGHLSKIKTAINLVGHNPLDFLVGTGLGSTTYAENLGVDPPPPDQHIAGSNDFGTLLVELGWVGVVLVVVAGAMLVVGALVSARRAPPGSWTRALLIAYPGVLVAMGAAALLGTPFRNVGSATTFAVLTGLVLAVLFQPRERDARPVGGKWEFPGRALRGGSGGRYRQGEMTRRRWVAVAGAGAALAVALVVVGLEIADRGGSQRTDSVSISGTPSSAGEASVQVGDANLAPFVNASVEAATLANSGAAGFRIGNLAAGDYTASMSAPSGRHLHVMPNLPYVFSVEVEGATPADQHVRALIEWRSASGDLIGTSLGYPGNQSSLVSSGASTNLQRLFVYGSSPPRAATAFPKIAVTGSPPASSAIYAQAPRFRPATEVERSSRPPLSAPAQKGPAQPLVGMKGAKSARFAFGPWLDSGASDSKPCVPEEGDTECPFVDAHGIPVVDYGGKIGVQYNPYTIATNGLQMYSSFLYTRDRSQLDQAIRTADWLVEHQEPDGRWLYRFRLAANQIQPPWPSAIAQGGGISLLVRVWRHTGDSRYLEAAKRALRPYSQPVARGGVLARWGRLWFYEEAPNPDRPLFILNGFMYALVGLYDLSVAAPRSAAGRLYERGRHSLVEMLPLYDHSDGISTYDLSHLTMGVNKKPSGYNRTHVRQLKAINSVSPSPVLRYYMNRWSRGLEGPAWP